MNSNYTFAIHLWDDYEEVPKKGRAAVKTTTTTYFSKYFMSEVAVWAKTEACVVFVWHSYAAGSEEEDGAWNELEQFCLQPSNAASMDSVWIVPFNKASRSAEERLLEMQQACVRGQATAQFGVCFSGFSAKGGYTPLYYTGLFLETDVQQALKDAGHYKADEGVSVVVCGSFAARQEFMSKPEAVSGRT